MSVFINENSIQKQVTNIFAHIDGAKKKIIGVWANKSGAAAKVFGSSDNSIIQITKNTSVAKSRGQSFTLLIPDKDETSCTMTGNEQISLDRNIVTITENATTGSIIPVKLQSNEITYTVNIIIAPDVSEGSYKIRDANDLLTLRKIVANNAINDVDQNAKLMNDIDLSSVCSSSLSSWLGIGSSSSPYHGIFDGQEHVINNMYINYSSSSTYVGGLFAYTQDAVIKNAGIAGRINYATTSTTGTAFVGAFCGRVLGNVRFENLVNNCGVYATYSNGTLAINYYTGGICGYGGAFVSCTNNGSISGRKYTGGICGYQGNATDCHNTASISAVNGNAGGIFGYSGSATNCSNVGNISTTSLYAGGIVGYNGSASYCYNTASISSTGTSSGGAGGIVGSTSSVIHHCYNTGQVTVSSTNSSSTTYAGGIVGNALNSIYDCYNTGYVNGYNMAGGIIGFAQSLPVSNCYNVGTVNIKTTGNKSNFIGAYSGSNSIIDKITNSYILSGSFYGYAYKPPVLTNCAVVNADVLKTYAGVLGDSFADDINGVNNGYPILKFQIL